MIDAGGWHTETLTEDLDLSYARLPARLARRLPARRRVAGGAAGELRRLSGASSTAGRAAASSAPIKHVPDDLALGRCRWWQKLQATLHLTGYCIHLLMLSLCFLYPLLLLVATRYPALLSLFGFMAVFNVAGLAPDDPVHVGAAAARPALAGSACCR